MITDDVNDATEPQAPEPGISSRFPELNQRTLSAAILALAVIFITLFGGFVFVTMIIVAALLMMREWDVLTANEDNNWKLGGFAYVALPCAAIIALRLNEHGVGLVFYLLFTVWATDIGAYFAGRTIGGPKLAPSISPGKTWAGLGGGVLAACVVGMVFANVGPYPETTLGGIALGATLACVAQAGDLFESWMKRRAGVKDSGTLIPGHGGILDRVDGLIFTAPLLVFLASIFG